ncbi:MAG: 4Fe-4S binding protein [Spirochaetaceae bacterium]
MYQKTRIAIATLSMILFPLTFYYFSPYLSIMGAAEGIVSGSIIVFIMLFLSSIFLGRAFCSWVCPAGAIQDQLLKSRTKRVNVKKISWIKYVIWVPWLMTILFMFKRAGGAKQVDFLYQTEMGISVTSLGSAITFTIVIMLFYLISLIFGRRSACHTICWMAPFMVLGKKLGELLQVPSLRLKRDPSKCIECKKCNSVCPMSLNVVDLSRNKDLSDHNCILCGRCVDVCLQDVIKIGIGRG